MTFDEAEAILGDDPGTDADEPAFYAGWNAAVQRLATVLVEATHMEAEEFCSGDVGNRVGKLYRKVTP